MTPLDLLIGFIGAAFGLGLIAAIVAASFTGD